MTGILACLWLFQTAHLPLSELAANEPRAEFAAPADAKGGFTVKLTVDLKPFADETRILEIPGVLSLVLRQHDPLDRERQNYPAFPMPDGSVPVLEAEVRLHSAEHPDWDRMTIGIPLAMLGKPDGEHEVVLHFSGVRWSMYVDGELLDNDFPFGYPDWPAKCAWRLDARQVKRAAIFVPAIPPAAEPLEAAGSSIASVQYWTPAGHNTWVGDVATCFHNGRYHVFYLYDRRHHQSKFGKGAHYFEHLSTADFRAWTEHEAATPIEQQWECIGTGTPFVYQGRLVLAYGLHTGRIHPAEKTAWPAQWDYLKRNGVTGGFHRDNTPGYPAGSTYSVSRDGVSRFVKSHHLFHPCQNPSVFTHPGGRLRMLANSGAKGIWESDSLDRGWRCLRPDFPPGGDCTFFFRWGQFDYIIGGFKDLWWKPASAPDSAYQDAVRQGLDFYDGLNVPAVTEIRDGRFLMAGWVNVRGWGGNLVIRELIQFPGGRIGSRWMAEMLPATAARTMLAERITAEACHPQADASFLLTFQVGAAHTGNARCAVSFLPEAGEQNSCELQVRLDERRAQFGPGSLTGIGPGQRCLREGAKPHEGGNYAVENLDGIDRPFPVRVLVRNDAKTGGSLIDAEIAGRRTLLTFRRGLTVRKLMFFAEGVDVGSVQVAPLCK